MATRHAVQRQLQHVHRAALWRNLQAAPRPSRLTWPESQGADEAHKVGEEGQGDGHEAHNHHICGRWVRWQLARLAAGQPASQPAGQKQGMGSSRAPALLADHSCAVLPAAGRPLAACASQRERVRRRKVQRPVLASSEPLRCLTVRSTAANTG